MQAEMSQLGFYFPLSSSSSYSFTNLWPSFTAVFMTLSCNLTQISLGHKTLFSFIRNLKAVRGVGGVRSERSFLPILR